MRDLLPPFVAVRDTQKIGAWQRGLMVEEAPAVAGAVTSRRDEFEMGRSLARAAIADLGEAPHAIPSGPKREPQWPPGIVGSITHCEGYGAAAVARHSRASTIGIDAEVRGRVTHDLLDHIATASERTRHQAASQDWPTALFAVKEAIYKAWYPLERRWLGFEDAEVELDLAAQQFLAEIAVPHGPAFAAVHGRVRIGRRLVFAAVVLPAHRETRRPEVIFS